MKLNNIYILGIFFVITSLIFFIFMTHKPQIKREITIAAFGDSLTEGLGVDLSDSYPEQLKHKLAQDGYEINILNFGVSGDTSEDALMWVEDVLEASPDIVILEIGANDGLMGIDPAVTKENIDLIIKTLQGNNIEILFCGMRLLPGRGFKYSADFKAVFEDLAKEYDLVFMPYFLDDVALNPNLNIGDGIHPNRAGYEKIVESLYPYLLKVFKKIK